MASIVFKGRTTVSIFMNLTAGRPKQLLLLWKTRLISPEKSPECKKLKTARIGPFLVRGPEIFRGLKFEFGLPGKFYSFFPQSIFPKSGRGLGFINMKS